MRVQLDDFVVDEIPAYPPCGQGDHLFVRFEKTDLTTPTAVKALARALHVPPDRASFAGLKDRRGVTRQWASFEHAKAEHLEGFDDPKVRVLEHARHKNKLKTGHLVGNRFEIRIRECAADAATASGILAELVEQGCPNYYGEQRFGADGNNAEAALAFLRGETRPPRDRFQRRFLFSAFQSALFNTWLAARVSAGELHRVVEGDLMRKEDSGGLFTSDDLADLEQRVAAFEISATGPMFGASMRKPLAEAAAREAQLLERFNITEDLLHQHRKLGEGTRRVCRIRPEGVHVAQEDPTTLRLAFALPKGAYATTVLREVMKVGEPDPADG